jgi:hypothetical protein
MLKKIIGIWLVSFLVGYNLGEGSIIQFGPRLTCTSSTLQLHAPGYVNRKLNSALGWQAGVFTRLSLPIVAIQPELVFSQSGTIYNSQAENISLKYTTIELPVMLGISLLGLTRIQVGPSFTCLLLAQETDNQTANSKNVKLDYEILHVGYQVGIGVDIGRCVVDLKYAGGLSQFAYKVFNIPTTAKQNLWLLSIGFNIL